MLDLWGMLSTPSLLSFPGSLWSRVVAPDRVLSMSQIELNCVLNCLKLTIFGLEGRVFSNGSGKRGSIPGRVIPKTQKMVLDTSLLKTQYYKIRIKGKVEQSRKGAAPPLHFCEVAIEKGDFRSPSATVTNFTFTYIQLYVNKNCVLKLNWIVWNRTVFAFNCV